MIEILQNDIFNQSVVSLSGLYWCCSPGAASPTAAVCLPASAGSAASAPCRAGPSIAAVPARGSASHTSPLSAPLASMPLVVAKRRPPSLTGILPHWLRYAPFHPVRSVLGQVLFGPLCRTLPASSSFSSALFSYMRDSRPVAARL